MVVSRLNAMPSNPMVRSNGARLAYWFARRSVGSKLVDDSSITLNKVLHQRSPREFGSDICNLSRFLGKSENGNQRNGVWFGVSHYGLDSKRLFHGTGSTYMNASASENEKACNEEECVSELNRGADVGKLSIQQQKYLELFGSIMEKIRKEHDKLMDMKRSEHNNIKYGIAGCCVAGFFFSYAMAVALQVWE